MKRDVCDSRTIDINSIMYPEFYIAVEHAKGGKYLVLLGYFGGS